MWRPIETAPTKGLCLLYGKHRGSGARQQVIGERIPGDPRWIEPATIHHLDAWEFTHWRPLRSPPPADDAANRSIMGFGVEFAMRGRGRPDSIPR
jgi:hypothetical protein